MLLVIYILILRYQTISTFTHIICKNVYNNNIQQTIYNNNFHWQRIDVQKSTIIMDIYWRCLIFAVFDFLVNRNIKWQLYNIYIYIYHVGVTRIFFLSPVKLILDNYIECRQLFWSQWILPGAKARVSPFITITYI